MIIKLLTEKNINEIQSLYNDIKNKSITYWDKDYPSIELIKYDIERQGLWGVFDNNKLVGICFAGKRCEDNEEGFKWKETFANRGTFARLGVDPAYQNKGLGGYIINFILNKLKEQKFDGVRILVECDNNKAIKLYKKFNFVNCGSINREKRDYYLFELRLL